MATHPSEFVSAMSVLTNGLEGRVADFKQAMREFRDAPKLIGDPYNVSKPAAEKVRKVLAEIEQMGMAIVEVARHSSAIYPHNNEQDFDF